ncbi:MAG: hypothetical protein LBC77_02465 [Spirochaetaceae bacterium]|nr:hypothetical protein [Spirochaetaceae bacterium]
MEKGKPLGTLTIFDSKGEIASLPLRAAEDVKQGNSITRIWDAIAMFFSGAG